MDDMLEKLLEAIDESIHSGHHILSTARDKNVHKIARIEMSQAGYIIQFDGIDMVFRIPATAVLGQPVSQSQGVQQ